MRNDSWDISSRLSKSKSILFVAEEVVPVKVINDLLVDDSLKVSTDNTKDNDWLLLRRGWAFTRIFENREYT